MAENIETSTIQERAVLIGLITRDETVDQVDDYLDELAFLAETAGIASVKSFTQKMDLPDGKTFIGKGKAEEILNYVKDNEIDVLIFDDDLSPSQMRNLEKLFDRKIYDRSLLILDIFLLRARSAQARTQVELARSQYLLPRLTRMWTHLERQRGGTGTRGGAGEKEIETDRRMIRNKISKLKEKLKQIDKQMHTQRSNRGAMVRVALVGYTNAGKSTIMNLLSKSEVFAEDRLFATLDTTVRKVVFGNLPFLLSDTVGFIRKLPPQLVESFKSTLDEVREADILMHIVDISHPNFEDHYETVNATLAEIDSKDKPTIVVFNKVDAYKPEPVDPQDIDPDVFTDPLEQLKRTWMSRIDAADVVFISATKKMNIEELRDNIYTHVKEIHEVRYPYNNFLY
ncbi:GTPase HflX [Cryomorpha ignava]|uniref:GTPase HflX n=1 Tax=Cryomorpha ignava TaxID=101383 RepID=A0A7K3WQC9_9FLAO|nr:GTPase HflX [Cryomorpha ignava]NEN23863.1 GTPase HflX [Cryomorpha ignava]